MTTTPALSNPTRRELLIRDSITVLALCAITALLFAVTWILFGTFTARRASLAKDWSQRGRTALSGGHPAEAIAALRTALSYDPDNRDDELLLAEALGAAGHRQEATAYFLGLWEARPGDGYINLQLARLSRDDKDPSAAVNYYRAAIFGNWQGEAIEHRRETRLELANYLVDHRDLAAARAELLIAGSNLAGNPDLEVSLGDALLHAGDPVDALTYYQKAIAQSPTDRAALQRAGRLAYANGDYSAARDLLTRAQRQPMPDPALNVLIANSSRLIALNLSRNLPARERSQHLLEASAIAKARLDSCSASLTNPPAQISALTARWTPFSTRTGRTTIAHDPDAQDDLTELIGDTERTTATLCGQPTGDNALLLQLANSSPPGS